VNERLHELVDGGYVGPVGPRFVEGHVVMVTKTIDDERCPRCLDPLPEPPIMPAGSRVTECRCIPICSACGTHEVFSDLGLQNWPVDETRKSTI